MRYLREGSLKDALDEGPFDPESTIRLLNQVTSALALAHRNDIIHRDLKPSNILLDEDGNAYLADFGIAKVLGDLDSDLTKSGVIGSLDYISPEQARGEPVSPRTDIYSLGVVLFEVLTGKHPFPNSTPVECLYKHLNDPLPEIAELGENGSHGDINAVIQKATTKNPANRYVDVLELAAALNQAIGSATASAGEEIVETLTLREQEVLRSIIDGLSNREIANQLVITLSTVKWYVNQIYRKLGVRSRVQAILRARELNLVIPSGIEDDEAVTGADSSVSITLPEPVNPYQGLRPFQAADHRYFFGREKLVAKLIQRMGEAGPDVVERFLAVVGPSGSGKSSVVKAGLIPALWRGDLVGSERWYVVEMLPGSNPLDELEIALMRVSANQATNLREQLERDARGLQRVAQLILPKDDSELVLVVDQFEEVFTLLEDESERLHFLDLLSTAVSAPRSRVRVVVTMRADFYDRPLHYPEFGELMRSRMETVMPLSVDELERAIRQPADMVGVAFEEGLIPTIIEEVHYQPGALPLLQYALTELFDNHQGRLLIHDVYQEMGGTIGALAKRADDIFESLTKAGRALARQMFLRLVTLGEGVEDTRRRVPRRELIAISDDLDLIEEIIDTYTNYRLLSLDNDPGTRAPTVEVAHEAILREWERLRGWLDESRGDIRDQRALARVASDWSVAERDPSFLLRGSRLDHFRTWVDQTDLAITADEQDFLDASLDEMHQRKAEEAERQAREASMEKRSRRFLQALVGVFAIAAIVAVALSIFAFNAQKTAQLESEQRAAAQAIAEDERANAEQQAMIAQARELSQAAALNVENDPELAILLLQQAIAAWQTADQDIPPDLEETLHKAVQNARALQTWQVEGAALDVGFSPQTGNPYLILADVIADTLRVWDPVQDVDIFSLETAHIASDLILASLSSDGTFIAIPHDDNQARVYEVATSELVWELQTETEFLLGTIISPDGRFLGTIGQDYVGIWDLSTGELLLPPFTDPTTDFASFRLSFSGDGSRVGWSSPTNTFRVIETGTGDNVADLTADFNADISGVSLSQDGNWAAAGGLGNSLQVWDLSDGESLKPLNYWHDAITQYSMMFDPTNNFLAYAMQNGVVIMDLVRDQPVLNLSGRLDVVRQLAYNTAGDRLLTASGDGKVILWDLTPGHELKALPVLDGPVSSFPRLNLAFHPDSDQILVSNDQGSLKVIRTSTGEQQFHMVLSEGQEWVNGVSYSPDGQLMAVAHGNGEITVWDGQTGEQLAVHSDFGEDLLNFWADRGLHSIDFSPRCSTAPGEICPIATVGTDGKAIIWNALTGEELIVYQNETALTSVAFSPDGNQLAFGDSQMVSFDLAKVKIMDAASGEITQVLSGITGWSFDLEFSPDGKHLAIGTTFGDFQIRDVASGDLVLKLDTTANTAILRLAYTPDGKKLIANGLNSSTVWDAVSGERLYVLAESPNLHIGLAVSPDGAKVAVGTDRVFTYILDIEQLAALGAERLTRSFELDECQKYLHLDQCPQE
jgi:WD40 repeat protein/DNA-binding CsgD family transcriptional regulator